MRGPTTDKIWQDAVNKVRIGIRVMRGECTDIIHVSDIPPPHHFLITKVSVQMQKSQ